MYGIRIFAVFVKIIVGNVCFIETISLKKLSFMNYEICMNTIYSLRVMDVIEFILHSITFTKLPINMFLVVENIFSGCSRC